MNIGFFYPKSYPPGMGGSVHGYQLAKGLTERGHRLFSWYYGQDDNPFIRHFRGRRILSFLRRIDVLYVRRECGKPTISNHLRRLCFGRLPVVWEFNATPQEHLYAGASAERIGQIEKQLQKESRHVDAAIGVTHGIHEYIRDTLGIRRAFCIPNGSDPTLFAPRKRGSDPSSRLRVVWGGDTNYNWHDLESILEAAKQLAARRVRTAFWLYGDRTNLPHTLPENVQCHGPVPYLEFGRVLAKGDVGLFVMTCLPHQPLKEASPLKLFDYMACGLAVLAQNSGQTGEIIKEYNCGLCTSGQPNDIASKLAILEQDRAFCRRLGENGRRAVLEYYNWSRVVDETEAVLKEVTKS